MSNTFLQIYIQIVFAVKNRESLIQSHWEEELYKYITGIVQAKGQKMLAINGMPDHIHLLIGMNSGNISISELVREVKKSSNEFIKTKRFTKHPFHWQSGYGAFSYCRSEIRVVGNYIDNQKQHHKRTSFKDEYISLLEEFDLEYEKKYLFDWIDLVAEPES